MINDDEDYINSMNNKEVKAESLNKWRLMLGRYSENQFSFNEDGSGFNYLEMDDLLDFLYSREYSEENGVRGDSRIGSKDMSNLTVPKWITKIRRLFPKNTVEILEKHALEKYDMNELLTDKEVLEKLEPNKELLKNILQMKHLMKGEVLETAKKIVKKVADDESGSMLDSVIHSAVMAGIFAGLPMLKTNLIIFDTQVVDLSGYIDDPVTTLMSVQLGGGTDITKALRYCETLIENPHRTMVILISDLFEGGAYGNMYAAAKSIIESGSKLIVLTALDIESSPDYDKKAGKKMAALGAHVAAMTPGGLSKWIAEIIS